MTLRQDAETIYTEAIAACLPDAAVREALAGRTFGNGRLLLVAAGKAAWQMADCAAKTLGARLDEGVVITKYGHAKGEIPRLRIYEAGHPQPDERSVKATQQAINLVGGLSERDTVLFLLSGGGSALFEKPLIPLEELQSITEQLLGSGADIKEINTIRKRLSAVKGGRFAQLCAPAHVLTIVLSDVVGDFLDMIASGPAYPDSSTSEEALAIAKRLRIAMSDAAWELLAKETPKKLDNVETIVTGSVRRLCAEAEKTARRLGYEPVVLTTSLACEAREAGNFFASSAQYRQDSNRSIAVIAGGETIVHLSGGGLGGRNQELALSAAIGLDGCADTALFSVGSDGTDGPTDAAGGYVDGSTAAVLKQKGIHIEEALKENDSYHALEACGGLIKTGATGTNVNDLTVLLIRRQANAV
ncbi:MAG: glycerate kinase [Christensenella sp.]|nr:glycerate kinase [Christensenella sp.]